MMNRSIGTTPFIDPASFSEVDYSHVLTYYPNYIALFDPDRELVERLASAAPETFIFIFVTKRPVVRQLDWDWLPKSDYIVMPIHIDATETDEIGRMANQIIDRLLRPLASI